MFFDDAAAETLEIMGRELKCLICGHDRFMQREAQLNTSLATLFNLDFVNPSGLGAICSQCGYIHWFYPQS